MAHAEALTAEGQALAASAWDFAAAFQPYQQFFCSPGGLSLYTTIMLVQRVVPGRNSVENEPLLIPEQ